MTKPAASGNYVSDARRRPDIASRYGQAVRSLRSIADARAVVEVGSGTYGMTPFDDRRFVGVDRQFDGPCSPNLVPVRGSIWALPFRDDAFDVAVSIDALEHVPPEFRAGAVSELLRIACKAVILSVPSGPGAMAQDVWLDALWRRKHGGQPLGFLEEHVRYRVPGQEEIRVWIDEALARHGKRARIVETPGMRLGIRRVLMALWARKGRGIGRLYPLSRVAAGCWPLLRGGPGYRTQFDVHLGRDA
jgi:hypothetical protein